MTNPNAAAATILAQTVVAADQAAASALICEQIAADLGGFAPIASPAFIGIPTAPTAAANTNTTQLATTAYFDRTLGVANGVATLDATGKVPIAQIPPITVTNVYVVASQAAMLALAAVPGDIAIRIDLSNAEFILSALPASTLGNWLEIGTSPVLSVAGLTGAISASDLTASLNAFVGDSGSGGTQGLVPAPSSGSASTHEFLSASGAFATLQVSYLTDTKTGTGSIVLAASPVLTGTPTAPTAAADTNTTQLATLSFVLGQAGGANPVINGTAAPGTSTRFSRQDHVHPTDTTRASTASPALTGIPTSTTNGTATDASTQIATDAFVQAAITAALASLGSGFTTGDVKPTLKTTADTGWVMMNDGTIGDGSSGGTTRANADTSALFTLLWTNVSNANCPVSGGRGGSAAADFAAHKTITLPLMLGRALASAGAGSGLTSRALAQTLGEETHLLTTPEIPSHSHVVQAYTSGEGGSSGIAEATSASASDTFSTNSTGGGGAHNNMQPSLFTNFMIKL